MTTALRIEPVSTTNDLRDCCRHALSAGFDGVELLASGSTFTESELGIIGEGVEHAASNGERIAVLALAGQIQATAADAAREELTVLSRLARDLRVQHLNLAIPPLSGTSQHLGFARYQDVLNFTYDLFTSSRLDCEAAGVAIGLEVAEGGCFLSPVEVREIVDAVNSSAFGTCVDLKRIERIGLTTDWMTTLGRRVHAVRMHCGQLSPRPTSIDSIDDTTAARATSTDAADGPRLANLGALLNKIGYEGPVIAAGTLEPSQLRALLAESGCPVIAE
ncbi:MAG: hypothetical protein JSU63_03210 [Phycisphaerales bacterium]|nr:MAG: hypothetical protein JSU63_03210 [Phycisphaerales bacterium]